MKFAFDFFIHWIYAIVFAVLMISGFAMVSAKHGWILGFDFALADYIHRIFSAIFVVLTLISIVYEIYQKIGPDKKRVWFIFGNSGFQLFTFITALLFIISGSIIWVCMEFNMVTVSFAMIIHEYIAYIALASVIWHIYKKSHALLPLNIQQKKND
jgi:cytochrome b subunit of formate dehydrogenase